MKITIKNLKQQTFEVEVSPKITVKQLKQIINNEWGAEFPVSEQKLIYAGHVLEDDNSIETENITEFKFVVVLVQKKINSQPPPVSTRSRANANTQPSAGHSDSVPGPSTTIIGGKPPTSAIDEMIKSIMELGFSREMVERALDISNYNIDGAVELLLSRQDLNRQPNVSSELDINPLEFLRYRPEFQRMQALIRENPDLITAIFRQISETNPALLQLISDNQNSFLQMLNEGPLSPHGISNEALAGSIMEAIGEEDSYRTGLSDDTISPEDREAIGRLMELGFGEDIVIEAYIACGKNENLTADFLLSQRFQD